MRKGFTIVTGLSDDLDFKKILRACKKAWCCNGTVVENAKWGSVMQFQGDRRRDLYKFLIEEGMAVKENIKVHGA